MKKGFVWLLTFVFLVTGCTSSLDSDSGKVGNNSNPLTQDDILRTMTCTGHSAVSDGVESEMVYQLSYRGLYVEQIHTREKFTSENMTYLSTYRQYVEEGYQPYSDLDYYDYHVTLNQNELVISVDIDYTKVDTKKMLQIDPENDLIIQDGKVLVSTMKTLYESVGVVCR